MLVDREASAMLDCEEGAKQADCKHCQGGESDQPQRYWDIPLDADLLETIVKIYPDWFKDDDKAPQHDKNKESLKVKLMLRRPPLNKRADQGILPPLKSPPAFHEQIQKLERSNMGDILKHKFQKKPDRQELIQHHILDDAECGSVDAKKLSKKARLSDSMSPASDPLTKGVAEELLAQAVRENLQGACPSPRLRTTFEEDSGSDGAFSPSPPYDFSEHSQSSVPSLEALSPVSPASSSVSSPACLPLSSEHVTADFLVLHHPPCSKAGSRKKAKPKPQQPKTKQMKFHEYKGPPSAQKPAQSSSSSSEQQYSEQVPLNAQQHQLLIQLQMECEQQHGAARQTMQRPPAADQPVQSILQKSAAVVQPPAAVQQPPQPQQPQLFEAPSSPQKLLLSNFEDLKVTDLKAEQKKKGLPVSGSKPQLIQRLRSHSEQPAEELAQASSLEEQDIANDHIVQLQQIWIETLTREVERSREQLRECQLPPPAPKMPPSTPPPPPKTPGGENKKQIIQQLLQQKIQQQELQKRQQSASTPSLTALLESGPLNPPPLDMELPSQDGKDDVVDFGGLEEDFPGVLPIYICTTPDMGHNKAELPPPNAISSRSSSLPSFAVIRPSKPSPTRSNTEPQFAPRQPPNYNEATRHLKVKQLLSGGDGNPRHSKKLKPSIKSQAVDDVLDILISSGELSPSAAQEPLTPMTPKGSSLFPSSEPFFPSSAPKEVPLHLSSSLQSVLDLTPPPSTGFSAASAGVDFDFPLDLDLDGLDSLPKKPDDHLPQMVDAVHDRSNDRSMDDSGLIEWLEEYEESSGHFQPSTPSYDSLLGHEALDFFSADLDFKPDPFSAPFMPSWTEHAT